ncbi:heavy metal efflux pump CzcA family [Bacteroides sp. CAG:189]|nr:heavy metal efflux pump CzcA family [Bacteroides sp. CAG:189]
MLNKIIHFSLQNRILVLVASVLLLIGGTYTAAHTEVVGRNNARRTYRSGRISRSQRTDGSNHDRSQRYGG